MIQVIDRALDILELLGTSPEKEFVLSAIAENTGIQKTTCANILKSLVKRDYIEHSGKMKGYRLGYKAYRLVNSPEYYNALKELSRKAMEKIFSTIGETVVLAVLINERRVVISEIECLQGITARIKHATNLYRAASGRVILASYPEKKANAIIERVGLPDPADWPQADSRENLEKELEKIRAEGASIVYGLDIIGIAVPVQKNGSTIASVGICLPRFRFSEEKKVLILISLRNAAKEMEKVLENGLIVRKG